MFYKKCVLKIFVKVTGKHLSQSLFFNKVVGLSNVIKRRLWQVFSCEYCKIFRNIFFTEHLNTIPEWTLSSTPFYTSETWEKTSGARWENDQNSEGGSFDFQIFCQDQAYKIYFNSSMKCNIDINSRPETKFNDRNYSLMMPKYEATQYLVLQILLHLEPSGGLILVSHFNFLDSTSRMF